MQSFLVLFIIVFIVGCSAKQINIVHGKHTDDVSSSSFKDNGSQNNRDLQAQKNFPLLVKARNYLRKEQYEKAFSLVDRAIRVQPQNPWVWYEMANIYYFLEKPTEAKQFLGRAKHLSENEMELGRLVSELDRQLN